MLVVGVVLVVGTLAVVLGAGVVLVTGALAVVLGAVGVVDGLEGVAVAVLVVDLLEPQPASAIAAMPTAARH